MISSPLSYLKIYLVVDVEVVELEIERSSRVVCTDYPLDVRNYLLAVDVEVADLEVVDVEVADLEVADLEVADLEIEREADFFFCRSGVVRTDYPLDGLLDGLP